MSAVVRLHPIRSLVLADDAAYCERVRSILGDLGPVICAATTASARAEPADVVALARSENADILLLDATGCEADTERVVAALAESVPRVGVVVVCQHSTAAARRLGALPKWGWTQDLRNAVECAHADRKRRITGTLPAGRPTLPPRSAGPLAGWD
jgi:DNA-binding NarL/FixJ family response regulator